MIASVGPGLPQDLLAARQDYSGPLPWDADRQTPTADLWLESKFPLWARSILQSWADGAFEHIDLVVFSRADDAAQRFYYYVCELRRTGALSGPEAVLLDIAKIPRPSSIARTALAVRRLAEQLGVSDADLEQSISRTNTQRVVRPQPPAGRVCFLEGTPPPDRRLHDAIEAAGFNAVGSTLGDNWSDLGPLVEEGTGDPVQALARQLNMRPDDQRGFEDHARQVAGRARAIGAQAAVLWYTEEDESRVWNVPATRSALEALDIPVRVLSRRDWAAKDGAATEIQAFLQEIVA